MLSPASCYGSTIPHAQKVSPRPHDLTMSPGCPGSSESPVSPVSPQGSHVESPTVSPGSHHVPRPPHVSRVPPCTQGPSMSPSFPKTSHSLGFPCSQTPHVPRASAPRLVPVPCPHLGTPARGLPSDAPGTGSRCGPRSRVDTGTAPSPATRVACSAGRLTGHREGSGAMPVCWGGSPHRRRGAGHAWGGSHRARSPPAPPGSRSGVRSGRSSCPSRWAGRHRRPCHGHRRRHRRCSGRPGSPVGRSCSLREGG